MNRDDAESKRPREFVSFRAYFFAEMRRRAGPMTPELRARLIEAQAKINGAARKP